MKAETRVTGRLLAALCLLGATALSAAEPKLPKLLDLGAKQCIPCKRMAPVLEQLAKEYAGIFDVEFIDVWQKENVEKAEAYGITQIPTQVFLNPAGKELWRHVGFLSKEAILEKWKALGYPFKPSAESKADVERVEPAQPGTGPEE